VFGYGIRKLKMRKSYSFNLKLKAGQCAESWCFTHMFIGKPLVETETGDYWRKYAASNLRKIDQLVCGSGSVVFVWL